MHEGGSANRRGVAALCWRAIASVAFLFGTLGVATAQAVSSANVAAAASVCGIAPPPVTTTTTTVAPPATAAPPEPTTTTTTVPPEPTTTTVQPEPTTTTATTAPPEPTTTTTTAGEGDSGHRSPRGARTVVAPTPPPPTPGCLQFSASTVARDANGNGVLEPGEEFTLSLPVANIGGSRLDDVDFDLTVPSGLHYLSGPSRAAGRAMDGSELSGSQLHLHLGDVLPGSRVENTTAVFAVDTAIAIVGGQLAVSLTITGLATDVLSGERLRLEQRAEAIVVQRVDLATSITAPAEFPSGGGVSYGVRVTNTSTTTAPAAKVVVSFSTGFTGISVASGPTCQIAGLEATCGLGDLAPGASVTLTVAANLPIAPDGTKATVSAASSSAIFDSNSANDIASASGPIASKTDLSIVRTTSGSAVAGATLNYTLRVSNAGPLTARDVVVADQLPTGFSVTSVGSGCRVLDRNIKCAVDTVAPGQSVNINVAGALSPDIGNGALLVFAADVGSAVPDAVVSNNVVASSVIATALAHLTSRVDVGAVVAGAPASAAITVSNAGPSAARQVVIDTRLSDLLDGISVTGGTASTSASCVTTVGRVLCTLASLEPGDTAHIVVQGVVRSSAGTAPGGLAATTTVTSATPDPSPPPAANATAAVASAADLVVAVIPPASLVAGRTVAASVVVRNVGPSDAAATTVVVTVDQALVRPIVGSADIACTASADATTWTCAIGPLRSGERITISVSGALAATAAADSTVQITASALSSTVDPDPRNNTDSQRTTVTTSANLSVTATPFGPVVAGQSDGVLSTITIRNDGPSRAADVELTAALPAGLASGFPIVTRNQLACTVDGSTLRCTAATLDAGASISVDVRLAARSDVKLGSPFNLDVRVRSATPDEVATDDEVLLAAAVDVQANLVATLGNLPSSVIAGTTTTALEIRVVNAGPSDATGGMFSLNLPAGTSASATTTSGGTCSSSGQALLCRLGVLAGRSGETSVAVVIATGFDLPQDSKLDLTYSVGADSKLVDTGDDSGTRSFSIDTRSALVATVTDPGKVVAGGQVTLTGVVTANGPSLSRRVVALFSLPSDLLVAKVTPSAGSCVESGRDVTCQFDNLKPGEQVSVAVSGSVNTDLLDATALPFTLSAESSTKDPVGAASSRIANVALKSVAIANLVANGTGPASSVQAGRAAAYQVGVSNVGLSTARDVQLIITVPTSLNSVSVTGSGMVCTFTGANEARCSLAALGAGATATAQVDGVVRVTDGDPNSVPLQYRVVSATTDAAAADNTGSVTTAISGEAPTKVQQESNPSTQVGRSLVMEADIANPRAEVARNVVIVESLPVGMQFKTATVTNGDCNFAEAARSVTCTIEALQPSETAKLKVTTLVKDAPKADQSFGQSLSVYDSENPQTTSGTSAPPTARATSPKLAAGTKALIVKSSRPRLLAQTLTQTVPLLAGLILSIVFGVMLFRWVRAGRGRGFGGTRLASI